eukprot:10650044-Alexandrium_andersonii.AAC.1
MESWGVWDVRPISECLSRTGKRPIGGSWVGRREVRRRRMFGVAMSPKTSRTTRTTPRLQLLTPPP